MRKYSVNVHWSDEDECFVALVPEFPTLSAFGETREEAIAEAEIALEGFIEVYKEEGYELPKPQQIQSYSGQFRVRLPKNLHASLSRQAEQQGVSLNTHIVKCLSETDPLSKVLRRLDDLNNRILGLWLSDKPQIESTSSVPVFYLEPTHSKKSTGAFTSQ